MRTLIDGYNLMHAAGLMQPRFGPGGFEKARRQLIGLLAAALPGGAVTVVFDSQQSGATRAASIDRGVQVVFAPSHASADELVAELISADSAPRQLQVVSNDHEVQRAARRRRAVIVDCDSFLESLAKRLDPTPTPANPPEKPMSRKENAYWLNEFSNAKPPEPPKPLSGRIRVRRRRNP